MKALIVPLFFALIGVGGGVGAALFLGGSDPETEEHADGHGEDDHAEEQEAPAETEFARLNNQFVVPIVERGDVTSIVVMSLSIEVEAGTQDQVFSKEPAIRDVFLQSLFDHANMGGFDGNFTEAGTMELLKRNLTLAARQVVGDPVHSVLIIDIVRQDV